MWLLYGSSEHVWQILPFVRWELLIRNKGRDWFHFVGFKDTKWLPWTAIIRIPVTAMLKGTAWMEGHTGLCFMQRLTKLCVGPCIVEKHISEIYMLCYWINQLFNRQCFTVVSSWMLNYSVQVHYHSLQPFAMTVANFHVSRIPSFLMRGSHPDDLFWWCAASPASISVPIRPALLSSRIVFTMESCRQQQSHKQLPIVITKRIW